LAVLARRRSAPRKVRANCQATDDVGDFVSIVSDKVGGLVQVEKVDVTDLSTMPAIGVISHKLSAIDCIIQLSGIYVTSGLTAGTPYVIGIDSQLSPSPPTPTPLGLAITQGVGSAISSTELLIAFDITRIKRGLST